MNSSRYSPMHTSIKIIMNEIYEKFLLKISKFNTPEGKRKQNFLLTPITWPTNKTWYKIFKTWYDPITWKQFYIL